MLMRYILLFFIYMFNVKNKILKQLCLADTQENDPLIIIINIESKKIDY